jgi:hypothetical protein
MKSVQFTRRRSPLRTLSRKLGRIQIALEDINQTLRLLIAAQGQPRCYVDDRCPADEQQGYLTPAQQGVPEKPENSAD